MIGGPIRGLKKPHWEGTDIYIIIRTLRLLDQSGPRADSVKSVENIQKKGGKTGWKNCEENLCVKCIVKLVNNFVNIFNIGFFWKIVWKHLVVKLGGRCRLEKKNV